MSKKENIVRYAIIFFAIFLVVAAFSFRQRAVGEADDWKVVVTHISENRKDPPKVILYRSDDGSHWLITYTIDRTDKNRFTAIASRQLPKAPESLIGDKENTGVWVEMQENWHFFNEQLKEEKRDTHYRKEGTSEGVPFQIDEEKTIIVSTGGHPIRFKVEPDDQVVSVCPLTVDRSLWLLLLENDVKVVVSE
ncbi:hypothetical protein [Fervidibacillus halotolerans]|uniref:Uncharacterized protein n=1 Tax=Fervidibacillus halotolerans TaxID=2980027 RepID=A0A9E8RWF6_9BACI|nr:hypothetical protein [Fervidibacillus halotolerans]WAA11700.1 hypothetical protein OE105_08705 [Fervidibacillus halotolerans]